MSNSLDIKGQDVQQQQIGTQRLQSDGPGTLEAGDAEGVQVEASLGKTLPLGPDLEVLSFVVEHAVCRGN